MFTIHGHRLPRCLDYAGAVHIWETSAPVDRGNPNVRYLVGRDKDKLVFLEGNDVCFQLHRTVLVRWRSDKFVRIHHYSSASSRIFLNRFLPYTLNATAYPGYTLINNVRPKNDCTDWKFSEGDWGVLPETAEPFMKIKIDAKIARRAVKAVQPVVDWAEGISKLRGFSPPTAFRADIDRIICLRRVIEANAVERNISTIWNDFGRFGIKRVACLAMGGLSLETLPLGQLPGRSAYDPLRHLIAQLDMAYEPLKRTTK